MSHITRGFQGRASRPQTNRVPPGQHIASDFPVLSAGATPHTPLHDWTFALEAEDGTTIRSWDWEQFRAIAPTPDVHDRHRRLTIATTREKGDRVRSPFRTPASPADRY